MKPTERELNPGRFYSPILRDLTSNQRHKQAIAEEKFSALGERKFEVLIEVAKFESERRQSNRKWIFIGAAAYCVIQCGFIAANIISGGRIEIGPFTSILYGSFLLFGLFRYSETQKNAAFELAKFDDKQVIGPMIDALGYFNTTLNMVARNFLARHLPQSSLEELQEIASARLMKLQDQIARSDEDFVILILDVLKQVGTDNTTANIKKLISGELAMGKMKRIREAATACLSSINQRMEMVRKGETLLRPASLPSDDPGILLRPHEGAAAKDSGKLLRPADS